MSRFRLAAGSRTPSSARIAGQRSMRMVRSFRMSCQWRGTCREEVPQAVPASRRRCRADQDATATRQAGRSAGRQCGIANLKPDRSLASHNSRRTGSAVGSAPPSADMQGCRATPRRHRQSGRSAAKGSPDPLISRKAARSANAARRDGTSMVAAAKPAAFPPTRQAPSQALSRGMPAGIEWM